MSGSFFAVLFLLIVPVPFCVRAADVSQAKDRISQEWLDDLWVSHLLFRADAFPENTVLKEAFYRDVLRLQPLCTNAIDRLVYLHQINDEPVMETMASIFLQMVGDPDNEPVNVPIKTSSWGDGIQRLFVGENGPQAYNDAVAIMNAGDYLQAEMLIRQWLHKYPSNPAFIELFMRLAVVTKDWPTLAMVCGYYHYLYKDNTNVARNCCVALANIGAEKQAYVLANRFSGEYAETNFLYSLHRELEEKLDKDKQP